MPWTTSGCWHGIDPLSTTQNLSVHWYGPIAMASNSLNFICVRHPSQERRFWKRHSYQYRVYAWINQVIKDHFLLSGAMINKKYITVTRIRLNVQLHRDPTRLNAWFDKLLDKINDYATYGGIKGTYHRFSTIHSHFVKQLRWSFEALLVKRDSRTDYHFRQDTFQMRKRGKGFINRRRKVRQ